MGIAAAARVNAGTAMAQASSPPAAGSSIVATSGPPCKAGIAERPLDLINLYDLEAEAEKLIPRAQFGYIASGSGDEWTLRENTRAFDDRQILPRYRQGFDAPKTETELLGPKVGISQSSFRRWPRCCPTIRGRREDHGGAPGGLRPLDEFAVHAP